MEDITLINVPTGDQIDPHARLVAANVIAKRYRTALLEVAKTLGVAKVMDGVVFTDHQLIENVHSRASTLMSVNARRMKALSTPTKPRKR